MYEVEVCVGEPYPENLNSMFDKYLSAEAIEFYEEKKMVINLTRIWQLGDEGYPRFLFYLIGTIIHEFLHLFFYDNIMYQENTEKNVSRIAENLRVLSVGGLIGLDDAYVERRLGVSSS